MAQFPNSDQADGIWTLKKVRRAILGGNWPVALEPDQFFANTVLLLNAENASDGGQNNTFLDSSSNAHTITRNGNVTQGSFSPFSVDDGKWGNYFDGTGDYLSFADDATFELGSGDFTIECWVYLDAYSGDNGEGFIVKWSSGQLSYYLGTASETNTHEFIFSWSTSGSGNQVIASNYVPPLNEWHHYAVSRNSNEVRLYVDGVLKASDLSFTDTLYSGSAPVAVGTNNFFSNAWDVNGYISNARIVKGTGLYSAAFTPPTEPLTAISGTSLLTCQSNRFVDNSSNAHSTTINGTPKIVPFSPFPQTTAYDASTNGGSGYFDGTSGTYLTVSDATAFDFGTGDFTVECWFYEDSLVGSFVILGATEGVNQYWGYGALSSGGMSMYSGGTDIYSGTANTPVSNQWNHLVWQRESGVASMYINGERVYNAAYTEDFGSSATGFRIGRSSSYNNYYTNGNISNFRVVKGSAVYSGASFTPPTAPLTNVTNTSLLTNFTNASIYDATGKNVLETVGNAQVDTTTVKYGTGAMEFDGTGDYLVFPASEQLAMGTGDFTAECWVYRTATGSFFDTRVANDAAGFLVQADTNGKLALFTNAAFRITDSGTALPTSEWFHVALVRSNGTTTLYKNGVSVGTYSDSNDYNAGALTVGSNFAISTPITGFIDDFRITKGIARYTANFTPPTKQLPIVGE